MADDQYWLYRHTIRSGPFTLEQLRAMVRDGSLQPEDTLLPPHGMSRAARDIPGLFPEKPPLSAPLPGLPERLSPSEEPLPRPTPSPSDGRSADEAISATAPPAAAPASTSVVDLGTPRAERREGLGSPEEAGLTDLTKLRRVVPAWRRMLTPSSMVFALVLFFLPWLDLSCNGRTVITQSGLQTGYGGCSLAGELQQLAEEQQAQAGKAQRGGADTLARPADGNRKIITNGAVLSWFFLLFVLLALVLGLPGFSFPRSPFFQASYPALVCGAIACAILTSQMAIGFPLERDMKRDEKARKETAARRKGGGLVAAPQELIRFEVHYTSWLWLTYLCTFVPVVLLVVEKTGLLQGRGGKDPGDERTIPAPQSG